jgi:hypothetical protein
MLFIHWRELRQVKLTADQNQVAGVTLTYDNYFKLLYSAAVNYDESFVKKTARRSAFVHELLDGDGVDPHYDIDIAVDTILANAAARSSPVARIPTSQWYELSSEARELWQSLSKGDCAIILGSSSKAAGAPSLPRPSKSLAGSQ